MGIKVPSLVRLPKHKRFEFEPRYYDPIKERVEKRERELAAELEGQALRDAVSSERIRGSFARPERKAGFGGATQSIFVLLFASALGGYIFYGNIALWIAAFFAAAYVAAKAFKLIR